MRGPGGQGKKVLKVGDEGAGRGRRGVGGRRVEKIGENGGREKEDSFARSKKGRGEVNPLSTPLYICVHPTLICKMYCTLHVHVNIKGPELRIETVGRKAPDPADDGIT